MNAKRNGSDVRALFGASANALSGEDSYEPSAPAERKLKSLNVQDYDKNATVQTGPGLPRWEWQSFHISWSGPVERGQQLGLWLVPPWANTLLGFLRTILLALLVLCVFGLDGRAFQWINRFRPPPHATSAAVLLALLLPLASRAQEAPVEPVAPSPELLSQLRERLLEPPSCQPNCASISRMQLTIAPRSLEATLEVGAAARTAIPLPGSASQWSPEKVTVDGRPATGLRRTEDGRLYLQLDPGSHQVKLDGALPLRDTVQLALPLRPHRVEVSAQGWTVDGVHEDGLSDDDLQLSRKAVAAEEGAPLQAANLPPFVEVTRALVLGLNWEVETHLRRVTPTGSAIVLEVPLLPGESVTSNETRVQNGKVQVNLGPSVTEAHWSSVLAQRSPIVLTAPAGVPWAEVWRLEASPVWHVTIGGIPMIHAEERTETRLPEWRPWPGESVKLDVVRPSGVGGQTVTIDQASLELQPGVRATDGTLKVNLRSSRGGQYAITLPEGATLSSVKVNDVSQPIRAEGRTVQLPLVPGSMSAELGFRQPTGISMLFRTPEVKFEGAAVNVRVELTVPRDRWVLFVGGPRVGPAVLFWSLLLVLLALAAALGRVTLTPLRTLQWVLLSIGLSQVPVVAGALVLGWLLAVGWREKNPEVRSVLLYNFRQLALVGWGVVSIGVLFAAIHEGLLGTPEMQIEGNGSSGAALYWFIDRISSVYPRAWVFSVPLLVYRLAMLAWALWLARACLAWIGWVWGAFNEGGLWRRHERAPVAPAAGPRRPPGGAVSADCLACRIVSGAHVTPGGVLLRAEGLVLHAFADPSPLPGWVVITSERHLRAWYELDEDESAAVGRLTTRVMRAQREVLGADHAYAFAIGEVLHHFHLHVVPRYPDTPAHLRGRGCFEPRPADLRDPAELADAARRLADALR